MIYFLCFFILSLEKSSCSLLTTLSNKDIEISDICMQNKHPCVLESVDCSNKLYSTSVRFKRAINNF